MDGVIREGTEGWILPLKECFLVKVLAFGAGQFTRGESNNLLLYPLNTNDASPVPVATTNQSDISKCTAPDEDNSLKASRNQPAHSKMCIVLHS